MRRSRHLRVIAKVRDGFAVLEPELEEHGKGSSCRSCSTPYCCAQKIEACTGESLLIADYLIQHGRATPELMAELRRAGKPMQRAGDGQWFRRGIPCVFLERGRCSIYPVRPLMCRAYFVLSDPVLCRTPLGARVSVSMPPPSLFARYAQAWAEANPPVHAALPLGVRRMILAIRRDEPLPRVLDTFVPDAGSEVERRGDRVIIRPRRRDRD